MGCHSFSDVYVLYSLTVIMLTFIYRWWIWQIAELVIKVGQDILKEKEKILECSCMNQIMNLFF